MRFSIAVCAAVLVLLENLSVGVAAEPKEVVAASVAAMRGENLILGSLRLGQHWDGPEGATIKLVSEAHPLVVGSMLEAAAQAHDLKVAQVEEIVVGFSPPTTGVIIVVLDNEKAADALDGKLTPTDGEESIGGRKFATYSKTGSAKSRIDPRVLQVGKLDAVKELFGTDRPRVAKEIAAAFLATAEKSNILTIDASPSVFEGQLGGDVSKTPFAKLFAAKRWRVTFHAEKGLRIVLRAECADEAAAQAAVEPLQMCVGGLDTFLKMDEEQMPEAFRRKPVEYPRGPDVIPVMQRAFQETRKALGVSKAAAAGNVAEVTIAIETDRPVTTAVMLLSMLPRAEEKPAVKQPVNE